MNNIKRIQNNSRIIRNIKYGEFVELLSEKDNVSPRTDDPKRNIFEYKYRQNKPIIIKNATLSIQCSEMHYCEPRETISYNKYTEMEVAIFFNEKWSRPSDFNCIKKFDYLWENLDYSVGSYISVEIIQEIYTRLKMKLK